MQQQLVRRSVGEELLVVDCQYEVPDTDIDSDLGQRRPIAILLVVSRENLDDAVAIGLWIELELGPGQRDCRSLGDREVAPGDVGMSRPQLGDHLADQVVQIRAMRDMRQPRLILSLQTLPVVAVHVLHVEEVAEASPDFVEDLRPFFRRHAVDPQTRGGDVFGRVLALGTDVVQLVASVVSDQDLGAVLGQRVPRDVLGQSRGFPILERKNLQRAVDVGATAVVARTGSDEQEVSLDRGQTVEVVSLDRHASDPVAQALEIDADEFLVLLAVVFAVLIFALVLAHRDLVTLGSERVLDIVTQGQGKDGCLAIGGEVPLDRRDLRGVGAIPEVVKILPVWIPDRLDLVEHVGRDLARSPILDAPDVDRAETALDIPVVDKTHRERQMASVG